MPKSRRPLPPTYATVLADALSGADRKRGIKLADLKADGPEAKALAEAGVTAQLLDDVTKNRAVLGQEQSDAIGRIIQDPALTHRLARANAGERVLQLHIGKQKGPLREVCLLLALFGDHLTPEALARAANSLRRSIKEKLAADEAEAAPAVEAPAGAGAPS